MPRTAPAAPGAGSGRAVSRCPGTGGPGGAALPDYAPEGDDRGGDALVPAAVIGAQDGAPRQSLPADLPRAAEMARKPSPAPRDLPGAAAA